MSRMLAGVSPLNMSEARLSFVETSFPAARLRDFVRELRSLDNVQEVRQLLSNFLRKCVRPETEAVLGALAGCSRYQLGLKLPDLLLSLRCCVDEARDRLQERGFSEPFVHSVFMESLFTKSFLERLDPLLVRSLKYHFVLQKTAYDKRNDFSRKSNIYEAKIQEMVDELGTLPQLTAFCRSSIVQASHHIVSKICLQAKTAPKSSMDLDDYQEKFEFVHEWLQRWSIYDRSWQATFTEYAEKMLISQLCEDSFNIFIADYPNTSPFIKRLKTLMNNRDWFGREKVLQNLCESISSRLLHVGVHTRDILKAYACAVESLVDFDDSFVLVHKVCDLIKKYVKTRPDTVRTIIHFITAEKPGQNAERVAQLVDKENLMNVNDEYVIMLEDAEKGRWDQWQPDPYDANPTESRLFRESADVFNMLVSIYGSRDLFVKEYQHLLASSLISNGWGEHKEGEQLYLETMKKRFTEGELNQCEVMLRDVGDSERLFKFAVAEGMRLPFFPRIISSVFWPEVKKDNKFKILEPFKGYMEQYLKSYEEKKPTRTISWYKDYGSCVKMDVSIGDCTLAVEAPISFAQVLLVFLETTSATVAELCTKFEMDKGAVLKRLEFWKERGVLCPLKDAAEPSWEISRSLSQMERAIKQAKAKVVAEEHVDSEDEEEEEVPIEEVVDALEQYWMYTKNLLLYHSGKDPLTPAKLCSMYKMFSSPGKPPPSIEAVMMFMQRKIKMNWVVFENGHYKPDKDLKNVLSG